MKIIIDLFKVICYYNSTMKFILNLIFSFLRTCMRAYTIRMLWNIFLIHLGLQPITMLLAFGLTLFVQVITPDDSAALTLMYLNTQKDETKNIENDSIVKGKSSYIILLAEVIGFGTTWLLMKTAFLIFS